MPISLNDYTNLIQDPLSQGLFKNLFRLNDVIKIFPVVEVGASVVRGQRWLDLPSQHFRDLNETYTESTGTTEPAEDRLAIWGGRFTEDDAYSQFTKEPQYKDPVQQQFDMHTKSMDRGIANELINGAIATEPKGFEGLHARFVSGDFPASQVFELHATNAFNVLADAASATTFFETLDDALYQCGLYNAPETGKVNGAILLNKKSFLGMQKAAKLAGYSINVMDLLEHTWTTYRGLPFVDMGLKVDKSTEIILDTYDPGDSGNDATRLYLVRFAPTGTVKDLKSALQAIDNPGSDGLSLVQAGGFRKLGPIETLTSTEWGMEWILGMAHVGDDYCAAMIEHLQFGA